MLGALSAMAFIVAACVGCGSDGGGYDNASRPPAPISISISISGDRIGVAPARLGAGPVVLLISNQSSRSRDLTLSAPDSSNGSCVESDASSGPINPQGAARIQLPLVEGPCEIGVADGTLEPVRLTVGPERESAQQDLLQP
ncbi:MAG TPA: hypothetical protein VKB25_08820 [Conexibacter sp.]|nr:hypothetical protein [Conexibacter sp.]